MLVVCLQIAMLLIEQFPPEWWSSSEIYSKPFVFKARSQMIKVLISADVKLPSQRVYQPQRGENLVLHFGSPCISSL